MEPLSKGKLRTHPNILGYSFPSFMGLNPYSLGMYVSMLLKTFGVRIGYIFGYCS